MKTLLTVVLIAAGTATAQTGLIAHKSHSGTAATFAFAAPGNFGGPPIYFERTMPPLIGSIQWINDTTVVQKTDRFGTLQADTLFNHPIYSDPNIPLDSIRHMQGIQIQLIDTMNRYKHEMPAKAKKQTKKVQKKTPVEKQNKPDKQKGILWLLFIGGGTFTGMLLFGRRKEINKSLVFHAS